MVGGRLLKVEILLSVLNLLPLVLFGNLYCNLALLALYHLLLFVREGDAIFCCIVELRKNLDAVFEKHLHRAADDFAVLTHQLAL